MCFLVVKVEHMLGACQAGCWVEVGEEGGRRGRRSERKEDDRREGLDSFSKIGIYYILRSSMHKKLIITIENTKVFARINSRGQLKR
jgi:hypothetical protein